MINTRTILSTLLVAVMASSGLTTGTAFSEVNRYQNLSYLVMNHGEFDEWVNTHTAITQKTGADGIQNVALSGNASAGEQAAVLEGKIESFSYILGPGDVISVMVEGKPELSRENIALNADGMISLPLAGEFSVIGKNKDVLLQEITAGYKEYLISPQVSLILKKHRPQYTYVLGAVKSPGAYQHLQVVKNALLPNAQEIYATSDFRITHALESASGVLGDADLQHVHVFNEQQGTHRVLNLFDLIILGKTQEDTVMKPGDVIYVPRLDKPGSVDVSMMKLVASSTIGSKTFPVKIYGLVNEPNIYELKPNEMTLQAVLAKAGGTAPQASKEIIIARTQSDGRLKKLAINSDQSDVLLHPHDLIIVSDTTIAHKVDRFFGGLSKIMLPFYLGSFTAANLDRVFE